MKIQDRIKAIRLIDKLNENLDYKRFIDIKLVSVTNNPLKQDNLNASKKANMEFRK